MEAVLNGGPWTFDNNMLILERVQLGMQIEQIPLTYVNMWVQVHDLPMGFMKEKVGTELANYIGAFLEYDKNNNSSFWRQYMRIRVRIDVRMPLKKIAKVKDKEGRWCTVNFKYEKLGIFCFVCGIMGHAENKCEVRFSMEQDDGTRGWSADIRADSRRQGSRIVSRWLNDERSGGPVQGGVNTARQASGPIGSSSLGPTGADVASNLNNNHNSPNHNQGEIIGRQNQSLVFNEMQTPPAVHSSQQITPIPTNLYVHTSQSQLPTFPAFISSNFPFQNDSASSMSADNIIPTLNSPIILSQPATETNNSQSLTHHLLTFNSQSTSRDPQPIKSKPTRHARAIIKSSTCNQTTSSAIPDPKLIRPNPRKKPKFTIPTKNPTHSASGPLSAQAKHDEGESQTEKKRRREEEKSTNIDTSQITEHFLTAGPGSQDCRDQ
jgi:hypothetical protein